MVALETPSAVIGSPAHDFSLPGTDGKTYTLNDVMGEKGLLLVFMCNHCPYVQKQLDRMVQLSEELRAIGIGMVAINANDPSLFPADSPENMKKLAEEKAFPFPYLYDESQKVARSYGAVCTPDFFGYNADRAMQYRGRLDNAWSGLLPNPERELFAAMQDIANAGKTDRPQNPSIGCSIKWKSTRDKAAQSA